MNQKKAYCQMILAMSIFGTLGLLCRYLPIPSVLLALVRGIVGSGCLFFYKTINGEKTNWKVIKDQVKPLFLSGIILGVDWILLFEAYRFTTVATATLSYYMAPILVIIASHFLMGEKVTKRKGICALLGVIGMILASGVFQTHTTANIGMKGIALGILAAVLYAVYILINRKMKNIGSYDRAVIQLGIAAVVLIPYSLLKVDWNTLSLTNNTYILLAIAGIFHTAIAYGLYLNAVPVLPGQTIAMMSYIDPIVAIGVSAMVLHETVDTMTLIGSIMLLGSMMLSEYKPSQHYVSRRQRNSFFFEY